MRRLPAILAFLVILTALLVTGCGGSGDSSTSTDSGSSPGSTETTDTVTTESTTTDATAPDNADQARSAMIAGVRSTLLGNGLPSGYTSCVIDKAQNDVTDAQIEALLKTYAGGDKSVAEDFGRKLGTQCIAEGAGIDQFRAKFLGSIRSGFAGSKLSAAFQNCVIQGARTEVSDSQLSKILLLASQNSAVGTQKGQAIGRKLALECKAKGIAP